MLDQQALRLVDGLLEAEIRLRDQAVARSAQTIKERMNVRGMLMSGYTVSQITDLLCQEFRARTHLAWDLLQRVFSDVGIPSDERLTSDLEAWLAGYIESTFQVLARKLRDELDNLGIPWGVGPLQDEATALKREFHTRVELLVLALSKRAALAGSAPSSPIMNFYGTVGAVQTGALSTANVGQQVGQADVAALRAAVEKVANEVGAAADLAADSRAELEEVLSELRVELAKQKPNSIRMRQLAMGAATAIQAAAALRPAYEALKVALLPLGVLLP